MEFDIDELLESVALTILHFGMKGGNEKDFDITVGHDRTVHLRVSDVQTGAELKVLGKDYEELGEQLVLACLHNLTASDMAVLRLKELNKDAPRLKKV